MRHHVLFFLGQEKSCPAGNMLWFEYFNGYLNLEIPGVFVIAYVASLANAFIEDLTSSSGLHFSYHTVSQYAGYY